MPLDPKVVDQTTVALIGITGTVLGAIISGAFLILSQAQNKRSEERRQLRETAFNTAITNWKTDVEFALALAEKTNCKFAVAPLDHYIIHMIKLSRLIDSQHLSDKELAAEIAKIKEHSDAMFEAAKSEDIKNGRNPLV